MTSFKHDFDVFVDEWFVYLRIECFFKNSLKLTIRCDVSVPIGKKTVMGKFFAFNVCSKQKRVMRFITISGCSFLLTACAGTLRMSWPALSPFSWFGSSLKISDQGVGEINSLTAMNKRGNREGIGWKVPLT
ncbi:DUF1131 family protein [Xenorhabdus thailandensis]|uniref:DUF1131 family protein n=1 Tax=Xenorhabdus thailandensis TaxID=3136255 RepID=UPI0030F49938